MRLLLYNICYGVGGNLSSRRPIPSVGHLVGNVGNLHQICDFVAAVEPDITALVEVDAGSMRTRRVNQAEFIAKALGHHVFYECKYGQGSMNKFLPIVRKQSNAVLLGPGMASERFHYFNVGVKRLIIELEFDDFVIFLVHLSLGYRHRHEQLLYLSNLIEDIAKPVMIVGDMNTLWGEHELHLFMQANDLHSANAEGLPTYPSWSPRRELDFVLYQSGIEITTCQVLESRLSDHLPIVCDFVVTSRLAVEPQLAGEVAENKSS